MVTFGSVTHQPYLIASAAGWLLELRRGGKPMMTPTAAQLLADALRLPEKDRGDVAAHLIESLDPMSDTDVEAAWADEIQKRIAELKDGRVKPLTWDQARKLIVEDRDEPPSP
jgi:putative addiction module component (TIGR02574 family)